MRLGVFKDASSLVPGHVRLAAVILLAVFNVAGAVEKDAISDSHVTDSSAVASNAFVDAAEKQTWERLASALETVDDVNQSQADGMTALHWASFHGKAQVVEQLLKSGADVDRMTAYKVTPLSIACTNGNTAIVNLLIDNDADVNTALQGNVTPLMLAARTGSPEIVDALINAKADVAAAEKSGQTALMWAAAEGHVDVVDRLIRAGADVNREIWAKFTPMMFAAREGRLRVAMRLVEEGVDVNAVMNPRNSGGRNIRTGTSALLLAVENGHFELAMALIEKGANPNDQRSGFCPLHAVTWVRKTQVGDNPAGDPAPRGSGSLHSLQFVEQLVAAGADINRRLEKGEPGRSKLNPRGSTPFLMAAATADIALMKLLLKLGADPMINNAEGCTPLMAAAGIGVLAVGEYPGTETEVIEAMRLLVDLGVDPNVVDDNGETAMHGVAYRNYPMAVAELAKLGANPKVWNQKNKWKATPRMIAQGKRPGSLKPSPETITALDVAAENNTVENTAATDSTATDAAAK